MKYYILILITFLTTLSANAQKFLRFNLNSNEYFGVYTDNTPVVTHDDGGIWVNTENIKENFEYSNLKGINVEDADFSEIIPEDYRVFEINNIEGGFNKIYVDNRAFLIASKNGDFGKNDTILFLSKFYNINIVFYTGENGRITKFYDGTNLYIVDEWDGIYEILKVGDRISYADIYWDYNTLSNAKNHAPIKASAFQGQISQIVLGSNLSGNLSSFVPGLINTPIGNFLHAWENIANNPENHALLLAYDTLSLISDLMSTAASLGLSGLVGPGLFSFSAWQTYNDLQNLLDDIGNPDEEKLSDYYKNRYNISLSNYVLNVSATQADVEGQFHSYEKKLRGFLQLVVKDTKTSEEKSYAVTRTATGQNGEYTLKSHLDNLKPGRGYECHFEYRLTIQGVTLNIRSNESSFSTQTPSASTGSCRSTTTDQAVVDCSFYNVPPGAECGIQYGINGSSESETQTCRGIENQTVALTGLESEKSYAYRAYISYEGEVWYGSTYYFSTKAKVPNVVGTWRCTETITSTGQFYEEFEVTLNSDGTAEATENYSMFNGTSHGTWTGRGRFVSINLDYVWTQTSWANKTLSGEVDDIDNPTSISGTSHYARGTSMGGYADYINTLNMTR